MYKWLMTTRLPNNCYVYMVFDTRDGAVGYADRQIDIAPGEWQEDASGHLSFRQDDYIHFITEEIYHEQ